MNTQRNAYLMLTLLLAVSLAGGCTNPADNAPEATVGDAVVVEEINVTPPVREPVAAEEMPKVETEPTASAEPAPAKPAAGPAQFAFTENTYIGFAGSKSVAGATVGTHYGQFPEYEGAISVDGDMAENTKVDLTIDTSSIETDNSILTGTLKGENFFDVENHPQAKFTTTSIAKADDGYTVTGNLTIRGEAKSVSFPAEIELDGDMITASAEFTINRKAWNIGEGWTQSVIDDDVLMQIEVEAKRAAEGGGAMDAAAKMDAALDPADPFSQPREGSEPKE